MKTVKEIYGVKMSPKIQTLIRLFQKNKGILRFSMILKAGFHPDSLTALVKDKKVEKIGRGLYQLTGQQPGSHPDLVAACLQAPKGVICLLSALSFHEATDEIPGSVDLAIARGIHANKIDYPPVKFYRLTLNAWKAGIEEHKIEGHKIKIYNLAKTVADCFKFRNRIGIDVAREALKIAVKEKRIDPKEIMRYAKICRVVNVIKPILETML